MIDSSDHRWLDAQHHGPGAVAGGHPPQVLALARSTFEATRLSAGGTIAAVLPKLVDTSVRFATLASGT